MDANEDGKMDFAEFESYFRRTISAISNYRRERAHGAAPKLPPSKLAESRSGDAEKLTSADPVAFLAVKLDQVDQLPINAPDALPTLPVPNPHGGFNVHEPMRLAGGQGELNCDSTASHDVASDPVPAPDASASADPVGNSTSDTDSQVACDPTDEPPPDLNTIEGSG